MGETPSAGVMAGVAEGGGARPREHLAFLDGLRAVLALYIVQRHAEVHFWRITEAHVAARWSPWTLLRYAHFDVDLFIVISGFCLFLPVARAEGVLRGGAATFFKRRAFRILPPYYAALAASMAALWLMGQREQITGARSATVWHHLLLVHDALSPFDLNSALWSVAVECHVYLLFPLLVLSWKRFGPGATLAWAGALAAALYVVVVRTRYRVVTPQYLLLFALGMAAAAIFTSPRWEALRKRPWGVAAGVLIVAAMIAHHFGPPALVDRYLGVEDVVVGLGGMALLLAAARPGPVASALSLRPLVFVGTFSYSVYLIHIPIVATLARLAPRAWDIPSISGVAKVAIMLLLMAIATAGAYAFFLVCERPFLTRRAAPRGGGRRCVRRPARRERGAASAARRATARAATASCLEASEPGLPWQDCRPLRLVPCACRRTSW